MSLDDEELTFFRVGLPDVAVARLLELCEESHAEPRHMIAALLIDVLNEDFEAHHELPGRSDESPVH